jgi:hypothetical protein
LVYEVPLTSNVVRFQELIKLHSVVVCQQKSPAPSLANGTEIAVAGLQIVAALALVATPITVVNKTIRATIVSEKALIFILFSFCQ